MYKIVPLLSAKSGGMSKTLRSTLRSYFDRNSVELIFDRIYNYRPIVETLSVLRKRLVELESDLEANGKKRASFFERQGFGRRRKY